MIVSVRYPGHTEGTTGVSHWGATLINVQHIDGQWMAVVKDNYDEVIYVVPATEIKQWVGEM